jgi:hypothetical protein
LYGSGISLCLSAVKLPDSAKQQNVFVLVPPLGPTLLSAGWRKSRDPVPIIPKPRRGGEQSADYSKVFKWGSAPRQDRAPPPHSHIKSEALCKLAVILDNHA